jgi:DNA-binding CsgD family transcriptional regulator/tetratricopeptide (TPR) repeat protein
MSVGVTSPRFVGRGADLDALVAAFRDAAEGHPRVVLVTGASGIGKSRLVAEFADGVRADGGRVLAGSCFDVIGAALPYGPIVSVLRDLVAATPPADLARVLGPARADLCRLLPELADPEPPPAAAPGAADVADDLQEGRAAARLLDHVLVVLGRAASSAPTVVAIDDAQWLDPASRDLVAFLAGALRSECVLVVLTYRAQYLPRGHPVVAWLTDLRRRPLVTTIELAPLSADDTSAQLAAILGTSVAADVAGRIHQRSEGNPLFTEELVGAIRAGSDALPALLGDALLAAVHRLPADAVEVLAVAAIAGRPIDEPFLAAVLGDEEGAYVGPVRAAVEAQVLVPAGDVYRFRHGLFAEAVAGALTPGERRTLHARIAAALDGDPDLTEGGRTAVAGESADHWRAAGRPREAFRRNVEAAGAAAALYAVQAAWDRWEQAISIVDGLAADGHAPMLETVGLSEPDLLLRGAAAASLAGAHDRAVSLADRALAAAQAGGDADPIRSGLMESERARILWDAGRFEAARDAQRAAFAATSAASPAERAPVMSRYATMLLWEGRIEESNAVARAAVDAARTAGLRSVEAAALESLGTGLWLAGSIGEAIDRLREARTSAAVAGGVEGQLFASDALAECLIDADRFDEALAVATEAAAVATRHGLDRSFGAMFRGNAAYALFLLGRWSEADEVTASGIDVGHGRVWALAVRARLLIAMGRSSDARTVLDAVEAMTREDLPDIARLECALPRAEALLVGDDAASAVRVVSEALALPAPHTGLRLSLAAVGARSSADLAAAARARRDAAGEAGAESGASPFADEAAAQRENLSRWDERPRSKLAMADLVEAEIARLAGPVDPSRWAAIRAAFADAGIPAAVAYAELREAEALLEREGVRSTAAGDLLREAEGRATAIGAVPLATDIRALARHARVDLGPSARPTAVEPAHAAPKRRAPDDFGLSARERQVLELVAAGRTNGQIALELFISLKTASVHVTHILNKLGASNRVEAAMIAERAGLFDPPA